MKHYYLYILLIIGLTTACKKNSPKPDDVIIDNRSPEEVVKDLTKNLSSVENIVAFTSSLKNVSLTKEDVSEGLTIFAPLDKPSTNPYPEIVSGLKPGNLVASASPQKSRSRLSAADINAIDSSPAVLTDKELKDHIVKGVFTLASLTNGMILTSLSGKSLKVTKEGNLVWINGVQLNGDAIASDGKQTVFIIKELLTNTNTTDVLNVKGSIEITVWDATKWKVDKPKGEVAPRVKVVLYRSREDYANAIPAYEGLTSVNGKVWFGNVEPGTYYIEALLGRLSNIFHRSQQKENGVYTGMVNDGLFQTTVEIDNSPIQTGGDAKLGNFKWVDINADGKIDNSDRTAIPFQSTDVKETKNIELSVLIGYPDNQQMWALKEDDIRSFMDYTEQEVSKWHKEMVILDGVLSDDDVPSEFVTGSSPYVAIDNFTFDTSNPLITKNWTKAYEIISNLNRLIRDIPVSTMSDIDIMLAQARGLRAYVYMQLHTYFGNIPLQFAIDLENNPVNATRSGIRSFIRNELNSILGNLPEASSTGKLTRYAAQALMAKLFLFDDNFPLAADYADRVLNSGKYQLEGNSTIFASNSKEMIWANDYNPSMFIQYFYNRNICPYIRLTEVYLISAEAHLILGPKSAALDRLNPLLQRLGKPTINSSASVDEIRSTLRQTWKEVMAREGSRFASLVRWDIAHTVLQNKGYVAQKNGWLPIPQIIINKNPSIMQNPGY